MAYGCEENVLEIINFLEKNGKKSIIEFGAQQYRSSKSNLLTEDNKIHLNKNEDYVRNIFRNKLIKYDSIDFDNFATIKLDLNYESIPYTKINCYDVVTNFGTSEHIINQLNIFRNIHYLCKKDGYIIMDLPIQGSFNHGFFHYNLQIFWHLSRSNNYSIESIKFNEDGAMIGLPENHKEYIGFSNFVNKIRFSNLSAYVVLKKNTNFVFLPPLDVENHVFKKIRNITLLREFLSHPIFSLQAIIRYIIQDKLKWCI